MSAPQTKQAIRHWIIQARPDRYDLTKKLKAGKEDTWYTKQYGKQIHPNDLAYFIQSGGNTAFHGWGKILNVSETEDETNLEVHYDEKFRQPIPLADLAGDPILKYISRLRIAQGTVFKLTTLEANAFQAVIEKAGSIGSGVVEPDRMSAILLEEYALSNTPKKIIDLASNISSGSLDSWSLVQATLRQVQARMKRTDLRNDTLTFLSRVINEKVLLSMIGTEMEDPGAALKAQKFSGFNLIDDPFRPIPVEVFMLLQLAKEYAIRTTNRERIYTRHLLTAFLNYETTSSILTDVIGNIQASKNDYLEFLKDRYPDDNQAEWNKIITETKTEQPLQSFLARLNADDPDGADLLNIKPEVEALSAVIAATDIGPPLAIGLFGDWGSGKTFFMNKIRSRIEFLSSESKKKPVEESSFCRNVVPIWFNAWHYLDTNLWASLVDHIFDSLEKNIERRREEARKNNTDEQNLEDPLQKLEMVQQMDEELKKKKKSIENRKSKITGKKGALVRKINACTKELNDSLDRDPFQRVIEPASMEYVQDLIARFNRLQKDWKTENAKFATDLAILEQKLAEEKVSLGDVDRLVADSKLLVGDSKRLWQRVIVNANWPYKIGLLVIVIGLGVVGSIYFKDALATVLTQVVTIGSLFVTFARGKINDIHHLLDLSDSLSEKSDELLGQENRNIENSLQSANESLNRLNEELLITNQQLTEVENELNELKQMEEGLTSAKRLISFINERARSEDYAKHLGLVSMVRKDFERLTQLMYPPENENQPKTTPVIERIILFIDDLDRCPENKVMEVLQAVHLLLAFKLFVVVVGVDARWVSRSIKEVHPHLLNEWKHLDENSVESEEENRTDKDAAVTNTASTLDYLEKIFQIPFWLKPLDSSDQIRNLIEGTIQDKIVEEQDKKGGDGGESNGNGDNGNGDDSAELVYDAADKDKEPDLTPEFLGLNENELEFLSDLGAIAGNSPRAIKRFINLYRLVKGTHEEMQSRAFSEKKGGYAEVQLILAIQSGHVMLMDRFTDELTKTRSKHFKTFAANLSENKQRRQWLSFTDQLKSIAKKEPLSVDVMKKYLPKIRRYSYHYTS